MGVNIDSAFGQFLNASAYNKLRSQQVSTDIKVVEVTPFKKGRPKAVTGFMGAGFIGNTAGMYIVRNKGFKLRAHISSHLIPPLMLVVEGKPTPAFRMYADEKDELLIILNDAPIAAENSWPIGLRLMEWLRQKGVSEIVSIEGMPFGSVAEKRTVFGFGIPDRDLIQYGVQPTSEGGVSGVNAVLMQESMKENLPWVTLLVPTPIISAIDYGGAASVIEILNRMYKLGVDVEPLRRSEEMRRQVVDRARKDRRRGFLDSLRRR